jgi:hypothetical protein
MGIDTAFLVGVLVGQWVMIFGIRSVSKKTEIASSKESEKQ